MNAEEIGHRVQALGDSFSVLTEADPAEKAEVYSQLGLRLTYRPGRQEVIAEARRSATMYEGQCPESAPPTTPTP